MRVEYCSDLHLEFGHQELLGGDVLILAGDIAEVKNIRRHYDLAQKNLAKSNPCWDFFNRECAKYKKVFYVLGNHEYYHAKFDEILDNIKSILPKNITLLQNDFEIYEDIVFIGATLWTDNNKNNPVTVQTLKFEMNDYRVIKKKYSEDYYSRLIPEFTAEEHGKTLDSFRNYFNQFKDKKIVVVTHHAPSFLSVNDIYKHETHINGGYASDLSELILDHPQINFWIHGHMHTPVDYVIGSTRIISNPRGYVGYEPKAANFVADKFFEI